MRENISALMQQMIELLGEEAAYKLARHFAGEAVYFPKSLLIYLDHEKIRADFRRGASYRELSIKYGRTTRQIRDILHAPRYNPAPLKQSQQELF